jgi:hypothetical protein
MKMSKFKAVAAGLLILSSPAALLADDSIATKPADKSAPADASKENSGADQRRQEWLKNHPEIAARMKQRQALVEKNRPALERAGVNFEDLKSLSPAERRAKIQPLMEKRITDLEKKKADGTALTEQEQEDLDALQQLKAMAERQRSGGQQPKKEKPASDEQK